MGPLNDPFVGRTIAQYDILARVGGGAMGVVYQARDTRLGRLVALKFLPQRWSHDEFAKQRFVREAQAASATQHSNICTIHDIETADDGQLFIVMAFYEGPTLKERLENGPMAVEEALEIATQIADGLAKAHAQGVVHRDIKPGNVMLTEDGVRILDFGLATFVDALKLTAENTSFGTPAYMSPEQVRGQAADSRSDVWAVGVVLYEMLAGHVPFQGSHAEAIAHAIRHEAPAPLRAVRPEIPEQVEQFAFRMLHKDPSVRFQDGRTLARALRSARGLSVPVDLRSTTVIAPEVVSHRRRLPLRTLMKVAAAIILAVVVGGFAWAIQPSPRVPIAVAPVINQTGFTSLQSFRPALTYLLTNQLGDSDDVRVLPYGRLVQITRRFAFEGVDLSSRAVIETISATTDSTFVLLPTLIYDNGAWRGRIEIRAPDTGTNVHEYVTAGVASSLEKDAAFGLVRDLAGHVDEYFQSPRSRLRRWLRLSDRSSRRRQAASVRSLDAAAQVEQGLTAFEALEYADARRAFRSAADHDRRSPLVQAWLTRTNMLMRQDDDANEAAARALDLIERQTAGDDAAFAEAAAAEVRGDYETSRMRLEELIRRYPDDPVWLMELAALYDRRRQNAEAIATYHRALLLDGRITRAYVELCRLYSPNRVNEPGRAREAAERALIAYRALGDPGGEAQALFCLVDVLRVGSAAERAEARQHAESALQILQRIGYAYNVARAYNYVALIAGSAGDMPAAISNWERSLDAARTTENLALQPQLLNNLGVAHQASGNLTRAVEYMRESYRQNERIGDQQAAARIRANTGAILVDYGNLEEALREIRSAQPIVSRLVDKTFEVLCHQLVAAYYRHSGRYGEAERELNQALSIARERDLDGRVAASTVDLALLRLDTGQYAEARELLLQALKEDLGRDAAAAHAYLGTVNLRLGDFDAADVELAVALKDSRGGEILPFVRLTQGELARVRGDLAKARAELEAAMRPGATPIAIEARALLAVLDSRGRSGVDAVESCVTQARVSGRRVLEARCRVYLARVLAADGRPARALQILNEMPRAADFTLSPEVSAAVHQVRAAALSADGNAAAAMLETLRAREIIIKLRDAMPANLQRLFVSRPDIRGYLTD
jgi:serine/threonine protein kinase/tetratricopeptide (TPR) repeat protein